MDQQRPPTQVFYDNNVSAMEVDEDVLMPTDTQTFNINNYDERTANTEEQKNYKTRPSILNFDPLMDMDMDVDQSISDSFLDQLTVKKFSVYEPQDNDKISNAPLLDISAFGPLEPISEKDKATMEISIHATFNAPGTEIIDELNFDESVLNEIQECLDTSAEEKENTEIIITADETNHVNVDNDKLNVTTAEKEKSLNVTVTNKSLEIEHSFDTSIANSEQNESLNTVIDKNSYAENMNSSLLQQNDQNGTFDTNQLKPSIEEIVKPQSLDATFDNQISNTTININETFENQNTDEQNNVTFDNQVSTSLTIDKMEDSLSNQENLNATFEYVTTTKKPSIQVIEEIKAKNLNTTYENLPLSAQINIEQQLAALKSTYQETKKEEVVQNFDDIPITAKPLVQEFDEIPISVKKQSYDFDKLDSTFEPEVTTPAVQSFDDMPIPVKQNQPDLENLDAVEKENSEVLGNNLEVTFETKKEEPTIQSFDDIPICVKSKPDVDEFDDMPIVVKKQDDIVKLDAIFENTEILERKVLNFDDMPISVKSNQPDFCNMDTTFDNAKQEATIQNLEVTFHSKKVEQTISNFEDTPIAVKKQNIDFEKIESTFETVTEKAQEPTVQSFDDMPIPVKTTQPDSEEIEASNKNKKSDAILEDKKIQPTSQSFDDIPICIKSKPVTQHFDDLAISVNKEKFDIKNIETTFVQAETKTVKNSEYKPIFVKNDKPDIDEVIISVKSGPLEEVVPKQTEVKTNKLKVIKQIDDIEIFEPKKVKKPVDTTMVITPIKSSDATPCAPSPLTEEIFNKNNENVPFNKNILSSTCLNESLNNILNPQTTTEINVTIMSENQSKSIGNVLNTSFINETTNINDVKLSNILQENNTSDQKSIKKEELKNIDMKMSRSLSKSSDMENSFGKSSKVKCCTCQGKNEKENRKPTDVNEDTKNQINDLKSQLNNAKSEIEKLNKEMSLLRSENESMAEKFKTASLSMENTFHILCKNIEDLTRERDIIQRHLDNAENAFSDVHQKYENLKHQVVALKKSDELLRRDITINEETIQRQVRMYESYKDYAVIQVDKGNTETMAMKKQYEVENNKLHAQIKRLEIKCNSLMQNLQQKNKENEELAAAYEEMINNVN